MVFVFGSNEAGIHGAGAARAAYDQHWAEWGVGFGRTGNSFAIPTKDFDIHTLPIDTIARYVGSFIAYAHQHPELTFQVTRIGCGLAGFKDAEMTPLFKTAPSNCHFDEAWKPWLDGERNYWGTY